MTDAVEGAVHGASHGITRKLGGIPVWAYGAGAVVGYVLYRRFTGGSSSSSVAPSDASAAAGADPSSTPAEIYDPATGAVYNPATGAFSSAAVPGISNAYGLATNAQWAETAANGLVGQGQNASTVSNALAAYLGGSQLTPAEVAVVQSAISTYGTPPGGVLPINAAPVTVHAPAPSPAPSPAPKPPVKAPAPKPPVHKPTPKPPVHKPTPKPKPKPKHSPAAAYSTYTVHSGDTLWAIVSRHYGHATNAMVDKVAHDSGISNPNLIHAGQKVKLPHTL